MAGRTVTVSGTPDSAGSWTFSIVAEDAKKNVVSIPVKLTVANQAGSGGSGSGSWAALGAPLPADASSITGTQLSGVSCPSPGQCVAVGRYLDNSGHVQGLLLTLAGGTWTAAEAPLPPNADGSWAFLSGVSCVSPSFCVVTGNYGDSKASDTSGEGDGLLLTLSGGTWTATEAPLPANADHTGAYVNGVSCASSSSCVAVGSFNAPAPGTGGDAGYGLLLTLSGGSWTAAQAPPAPDSNGPGMPISAVSCGSASYCVAVGIYGNASGGQAGLLLTLSGGSWTAAEAPAPANTNEVNTLGASCPSASECIVTEAYIESESQPTHWALLTWSNGSWSSDEAPSPVRQMIDLSCPSVSDCVSVGVPGGTPDNLQLVHWSDGSWTTATLPPPADADASAQVNGISCPSASNCIAVGAYHNTSGGENGLILTQSG